MSTSQRFIRLLSLLQTHRYWSGDELAQRLDISLRTLRRDVDRLRDLGYPVQAERGVGGGYQLAAGAALPPLVLDDAEAVALVVGLQSAVNQSDSALAEASLRALSKVIPVLPGNLRKQAQALASTTVALGPERSAEQLVDPQVLVVFAQGCRDRERIAFDYVDARGNQSIRRVEPAKLVRVGQRYYVVAYDLDRQDWRSFRVDRAANADPRGLRFAPRQIPGNDAAAFVRAGLQGERSHDISALVHAPAAQVDQAIGRWFKVSAHDENTCVVHGTSDDLRWAAFALAMTGERFSQVEPAALREQLAEWSARFADGIA